MSDAVFSHQGLAEHPPKTEVDVRLTVLILNLVLSFPQSASLSPSVGDPYHMFVIYPIAGVSEKRS